MTWLLRQLSAVRLFGVAVIAVLLWGRQAHLERFLTPERGLGYWLGISGGSMMLLLLIYPLRKRVAALDLIGGVRGWFRLHMLLGIVGPVCILFHSNFSLGATNSNVALFCMLLVAGSGVIGRYFYTRLHAHLDGRQASLIELRGIADQLRDQGTTSAAVPMVLAAIEAEEKRLLRAPTGAIARALRVVTVGPRALIARRRLHQLIRRAVQDASRKDPEIARHARRLIATSDAYAARRLDATRRVAEFTLYTRLFSLWHVLHVPLFIMLLVAGIAHVVATEIY